MIIAAGIAAQAASALANALHGKGKPGASGGSTGTDFRNLTADIDALLPGGSNTQGSGPGSQPGSGTGSISSDVMALSSDLLGTLGLNTQPQPGSPSSASLTGTSPSRAAQAYGSASVLGT